MKRWSLILTVLLFFAAADCGAQTDRWQDAISPFPSEENAPPMSEEQSEKADIPKDEEEKQGTHVREERKEYIEVLVDGLRVRTGAGTGHTPIGSVGKGVLLPFEGEEEGWLRTRYCGETAYVSGAEQYAARCFLPLADEKTERVIREGEARLGSPYVYGATRLHDGKGNLLRGYKEGVFDCSSFMQAIFYFGADILLETTTRTQIRQGSAVSWEEIRRGDLLFFTNASRVNKTGVERVGHVALYLGDGYILHTASDFAKIEPIGARWENFLEARRVL